MRLIQDGKTRNRAYAVKLTNFNPHKPDKKPGYYVSFKGAERVSATRKRLSSFEFPVSLEKFFKFRSLSQQKKWQFSLTLMTLLGFLVLIILEISLIISKTQRVDAFKNIKWVTILTPWTALFMIFGLSFLCYIHHGGELDLMAWVASMLFISFSPFPLVLGLVIDEILPTKFAWIAGVVWFLLIPCYIVCGIFNKSDPTVDTHEDELEFTDPLISNESQVRKVTNNDDDNDNTILLSSSDKRTPINSIMKEDEV